jgi:C4-dicarboxylate-specific signal transduction histidine kinase
LFVAGVLCYRISQLWLGAAVPDTESHSPTFLLLPMVLIIAAVFSHFGYIGLALDRALQGEREVAAGQVRMQEEAARLNEQIALLDRQRSVGAMSASLALQINQPLSAITADAHVARRIVDTGRLDAEQLHTFFDRVIDKTQRVREIIEQIQGFVRPSAVDRIAVDLNKLTHEVVNLVKRDADLHRIAFIFEASDQPRWVSGDPVQLSQVLLNLYRNAMDALKPVDLREIYVDLHQEANWIVLTVRDTGLGLTPEVLDKVGIDLFTTKANGLGMGIAISRSIIKQHGGTLSLSNVEQGGALVEITLPALAV